MEPKDDTKNQGKKQSFDELNDDEKRDFVFNCYSKEEAAALLKWSSEENSFADRSEEQIESDFAAAKEILHAQEEEQELIGKLLWGDNKKRVLGHDIEKIRDIYLDSDDPLKAHQKAKRVCLSHITTEAIIDAIGNLDADFFRVIADGLSRKLELENQNHRAAKEVSYLHRQVYQALSKPGHPKPEKREVRRAVEKIYMERHNLNVFPKQNWKLREKESRVFPEKGPSGRPKKQEG